MAGEKKLVRSKSGLRMVPSNKNSKCPFELPEPPWTPDRECARCMKCQAKFDFMRRKHHCRRCGNIFCSSCSNTQMQLPRMGFVDPVRLCIACVERTQRENDFYEKQMKILTSGANFMVCDIRNQLEEEMNLFYCRLSSDHRSILFDGGNTGKHEPVDLTRVQTVEILKSDDDNQETTSTSGLQLIVLGLQNQREEIRFLIANPYKKQSMLWISAIQKAMKLMFEAQNATIT